MAEALFAGLIGFLIGRGLEPKEAEGVAEAIRAYLGFEPPLGLTGYAADDIAKGKEAKAAVVVRGKTYDAVALDEVRKHDEIAVLGKKGAYLEVAPTVIRGIAGAAYQKAEATKLLLGVATKVLSETVPEGKTLLVYEWSAILWADAGIAGYALRNRFPEPSEVLGYAGGRMGFNVSFTTPKRVHAGESIDVYLLQFSAAGTVAETVVTGILI